MTLADRIVVMKGGHIQQQGTPSELFKLPVNRFVAGFLGSPPMNFLNAELADADGAVHACRDGFSLRLPEASATRARGLALSKVILGVRPSDLEFAPDAAPADSIELRVIVSEYVGAQSVLICGCGAAKVTVEIKSETPIALGETLRFAVRPEGVHLFDPKTEAAI